MAGIEGTGDERRAGALLLPGEGRCALCLVVIGDPIVVFLLSPPKVLVLQRVGMQATTNLRPLEHVLQTENVFTCFAVSCRVCAQ